MKTLVLAGLTLLGTASTQLSANSGDKRHRQDKAIIAGTSRDCGDHYEQYDHSQVKSDTIHYQIPNAVFFYGEDGKAVEAYFIKCENLEAGSRYRFGPFVPLGIDETLPAVKPGLVVIIGDVPDNVDIDVFGWLQIMGSDETVIESNLDGSVSQNASFKGSIGKNCNIRVTEPMRGVDDTTASAKKGLIKTVRYDIRAENGEKYRTHFREKTGLKGPFYYEDPQFHGIEIADHVMPGTSISCKTSISVGSCAKDVSFTMSAEHMLTIGEKKFDPAETKKPKRKTDRRRGPHKYQP